MSLTFSNVNLMDGQGIPIPYQVLGAVGAAAPSVSVNALGRAMPGQPPAPLPPSNPPLPTANTYFNFVLTQADCPQVNVWYLLTLWGWDQGHNATTLSIQFRRTA